MPSVSIPERSQFPLNEEDWRPAGDGTFIRFVDIRVIPGPFDVVVATRKPTRYAFLLRR